MESWCVQHHQWENQTSQLVSEMVGCGWCGKIAMGGQYSPNKSHMRLVANNDIPPAAAANPVMAAYMIEHLDGDDNPTTRYWACHACRTSDKRKAIQEDLHTARCDKHYSCLTPLPAS